jgi:biotin operon repressor
MVKNTLNYEVLLVLLSELKSPSKVARKLGISKQALNPYIKTLKANGNIKKIGYNVWEVKNYSYNTITKQVKIRGHAFIWKLRINKDFDWQKFNLKKLKNVNQIIINNKIVWLSGRKVTIYENKDFNGIDAHESRKLATIEMAKDIDTLKKTLNINFNYGFEVSREHYAMVKNELANFYNTNKQKMIIRDDLNKEWLWIDFSDEIDELETNKLTNSKKVQVWWNDNLKHDFQVNSSFILNGFEKLTSNQIEQATQINSFAIALNRHIPAYEGMAKFTSELVNEIHELREEIKKLNKQ